MKSWMAGLLFELVLAALVIGLLFLATEYFVAPPLPTLP